MGSSNSIHKVDWEKATEHFSIKTKYLLTENIGASKEFVLTYTELEPGDTIPMHTHKQAHSDYFISGRVWAQLGCRKVELEKDSATYFPAGMPHAYKAFGHEPLRYYSIYACEKNGQDIQATPADLDTALLINRPNMDKTRWAVAECFETWYPWEPSKGRKGLMWTSLFDKERGGHEEMIVGTNILKPGARYSKHYHDQPEIFIGLEGRGILFCGDEEIYVEPGVVAYVNRKEVHGAQTVGARPVKMIWVYGTEVASPEWSWTPAEDIFLGEQPLKTNISSKE